MAEVELTIAGRPYRVACREGEEATLRAAAALVDGKSREALAGLGALSESRQLLFASLLLADQLLDKPAGEPAQPPVPPPPVPPSPAPPHDRLAVDRVVALAERLERLADSLENDGRSP